MLDLNHYCSFCKNELIFCLKCFCSKTSHFNITTPLNKINCSCGTCHLTSLDVICIPCKFSLVFDIAYNLFVYKTKLRLVNNKYFDLYSDFIPNLYFYKNILNIEYYPEINRLDLYKLDKFNCVKNLLLSSKIKINSSEELLDIAVKYNKVSIYE